MNKIIGLAIFALYAMDGFAYEYNTGGYNKINEIKSWDGHIDIYFGNGEEHQCTSSDKIRFTADPEKNYHVSLLYAAFFSQKDVKFAYSCNASGVPVVDGVRVKN